MLRPGLILVAPAACAVHNVGSAAIVLAPLSALILQNQGFGALAGISTIVACLAINQLAYVIAVRLKNDPNEGGHLPQKELDDVPRDSREDDIHHQHKRHQNAHFNLARFAVPARADLAP
jgi:hypothetical protein